MAKILTDCEMIDIIKRAPQEIDDSDAYWHFLEALGDLIAANFGGTRGKVSNESGDGLGYTCAFHVDDSMPDDGGVFKGYDTDVTWENGKEK
jgi:hypothetical protein